MDETKTSIVIQSAPDYAPNNWRDVIPDVKDKDAAIRNIADIQPYNKNYRFRVIERTTTTVDVVIHLPD
jgi:hypothetical protein